MLTWTKIMLILQIIFIFLVNYMLRAIFMPNFRSLGHLY